MKKTIGEQVAQFMSDRDLKPKEMATLVGTSRQNIEGLVKRDRFPRDYIDQLAKAMGISVDGLLAGSYGATPMPECVGGETRMSQTVTNSMMGEPSSTGKPEIPTTMMYAPDHLRDAILLMGSLLGALDGRSRKTIGGVLNDLANAPDEASYFASIAVTAAKEQIAFTDNLDLERALHPARREKEKHDH